MLAGTQWKVFWEGTDGYALLSRDIFATCATGLCRKNARAPELFTVGSGCEMRDASRTRMQPVAASVAVEAG